MKKTISCVMLVLSMLTTRAQEERFARGTVMVGGQFSADKIEINESGIHDYSERRLTINPSVGYFIVDRLALGLNANATYMQFNLPKTDHAFLFGGGPFVRYYLPSGFFLMSQVNYAFGQNSSIANFNVFDYSLGPGYSLFLNKNVALEALLCFQHSRTRYTYRYDMIDIEYENDFRLSPTYKVEETENNNKVEFKVGFQIFF